jgi:hypothetical protein
VIDCGSKLETQRGGQIMRSLASSALMALIVSLVLAGLAEAGKPPYAGRSNARAYPYYVSSNPNPLDQLFPCGPNLVPFPGSGLLMPYGLAQSGFGSSASAPLQAFLLGNRMNSIPPFGGNSFNWGMPADFLNPMGGGPFAAPGFGFPPMPFGGF